MCVHVHVRIYCAYIIYYAFMHMYVYNCVYIHCKLCVILCACEYIIIMIIFT